MRTPGVFRVSSTVGDRSRPGRLWGSGERNPRRTTSAAAVRASALGPLYAMVILAVVVATACGTGSTTTNKNVDTSKAPYTSRFGWGTFHLNSATAQKLKSGQTNFHFTMVGFDTSASFYTAIRLGLADADKQFGVTTDLVGPTGFTTGDEVAALKPPWRRRPTASSFSVPTRSRWSRSSTRRSEKAFR